MNRESQETAALVRVLVILACVHPGVLLGETAEGRFAQERAQMVEVQIAGRGVEDAKVLDAMRSVPRHRFVPEALAGSAYTDRPLPIGYGQTISQPYIVAYMTEVAQPAADDRILEIGTGSGYQAAVLGELAGKVYSIEIIPELASQAKSRLAELGYDNVEVKQGDGYWGWPEHAPYDAIVVTAAAPFVPPPLKEQLKVGGKLVIPVGPRLGGQQLIVVEKQAEDRFVTKNLIPVQFVPLTRSRS